MTSNPIYITSHITWLLIARIRSNLATVGKGLSTSIGAKCKPKHSPTTTSLDFT